MVDRADLEQLAKRLADEGKLIESGWIAMRAACLPLNASNVQIDAMRVAYMGGAQHLFAQLLNHLDGEETDADIKRLQSISDELDAFGDELLLRAAAAKGSG